MYYSLQYHPYHEGQGQIVNMKYVLIQVAKVTLPVERESTDTPYKRAQEDSVHIVLVRTTFSGPRPHIFWSCLGGLVMYVQSQKRYKQCLLL